MRKGIILMTALPPTRGHQYLIDFALHFLQSRGERSKLHVLVSSLPNEPLSGQQRVEMFRLHYGVARDDLQFHHYEKDLSRQQMLDTEVWHDILVDSLPAIRSNDFLFASESYGPPLAVALGCEFVPCNTYREVIDISATRIRQDPIKHFEHLMGICQGHYRRIVTFFGVESAGKTTVSKRVAAELNGWWAPEWAREYLETHPDGPAVTSYKMEQIVAGQAATQRAVRMLKGKPFVIQDTDLLSTLGYYKLWSDMILPGLDYLIKESPSDLYIVMNENIPFAPDPLRYGGTVRESKSKFWIDLLRERNQKYHVVESTDLEEQVVEISEVIKADFLEHANLVTWRRRDAAQPK